jgi:hypothetical protein
MPKMLSIYSRCEFFSFANSRYVTRGHSFKLLAHHSRIDLRKNFFSERIVSVWNGLSASDKDFNNLHSFCSCIMKADLSKYLVLQLFLSFMYYGICNLLALIP